MYGGGATGAYLFKAAFVDINFKLFVKKYPINVGFWFTGRRGLGSQKTGDATA